MRRVFLAFAVASVACDGEPMKIVSPADRSFVRGGEPLPVLVETEAARVAVQVDGVPIAELVAGSGLVASLPAGVHDLTAYSLDDPGVTATARIYVDRLPLAPVDGWGFSPDVSWLAALSSRRKAADGLASGVLEAVEVETGGSAAVRLSLDGAFAEIAPPHVAWVESWGDGSGTLRVARLAAPESAPSWEGVREMRFTRAGDRLVARDGGLLLFEDALDTARRVAGESDAFAFTGPLDDVVSFAATANTAYRATFVDATGRVTVALRDLRPALARNATRREVALLEPDANGSLLLWDFATSTLDEGPDAIAAGYSADGSWLAAISAGGELTLSQRPAAFEALAGSYTAASFDARSEHLFALDDGGVLTDVRLGDPLEAAAIAAGVESFAPLADGAVAWFDTALTLHVRRTDGVIVPCGTLHPTRPEVVLASDGARLAFPTVAGARQPVRVVHAVTGQADDYGDDASRPTFLGEALAWLERRADAEEGGLANHDLWLFPEFPGSIFGAARVAERVSGETVPKSFAEDRLAVLAGLPRRGESWAARAVCVQASGEIRELGAADSTMRFLFFLPDGRVARFGPDGSEEQVMFLSRCEP